MGTGRILTFGTKSTCISSLSEAQQKQEEYATNIEKFLNLIQTLTDHKAELTHKVETLAAEKATTEETMAECSDNIEQLRKTINSQELSQEDVRRMEREKARVEEQIAKQKSVLEGQVAALTEAREKWNAIYELLEQNVEEYNAKARQLELVPSSAKHAKGQHFEVTLNKDRAAEGVVQLMGGVDIDGGVKPHVNKLVRGYESEMANEKRRMVDIKERVEATGSSQQQVVEDIEVSSYRTDSKCRVVRHELTSRFLGCCIHLSFRTLRTRSHRAKKNSNQRKNNSSPKSKANNVSSNCSRPKSHPSMIRRELSQLFPSTMPNTNSFN